jgi:hypothetical protein
VLPNLRDLLRLAILLGLGVQGLNAEKLSFPVGALIESTHRGVGTEQVEALNQPPLC